MKKLILILTTLSFGLSGQDCFEIISNSTGQLITNAIVENKACELKDTIGSQFNFQSFAFGTYSLDNFKNGGTNNAWQNALSTAENSENFLLIGVIQNMQSNKTNFKVEFKFPSTSFFTCLTEEDQNRMKIE